ncbi:MAG: DUF3524 domain-containing protein [bacterium]|nr:DUF3524 domain-containing protein [bacterium]
MKSREILFLEPWDDGSHRAFREGLLACSRHRFTVLSLPGRFWKWRMRAAAAWFADRLNEQPPAAGLILTTGFLNVADLRGLLRPPLDRLPVVLYMHENQLTYPLSPLEEFDFHFGFTNIISCLAADRVVFNSAWHRDLFLDAIPAFLNRMPEAVPKDVPARIRDRSEVIPVGLERSPLPKGHFPQYRGGRCAPEAGPRWPRGERPLLLWNHRWEFDKRPEMFAQALTALLDRGLDFEVALLGDPAGREEVFAPVAERLGARCRAFAWIPERRTYEAWLAAADIVVSCAAQEYFGVSVAEAIHAGAYAVLPRGQVYPSLYGPGCKGRHFYEDQAGLEELLAMLVGGDACGHVCGLDCLADQWTWSRVGPQLDALLAACDGKARR